MHRHEAQVIRLLPHLGNQRNAYRQGSTKQVQVKPGRATFFTCIVQNAGKSTRIAHKHIDKGHNQHHQPQGLCPDLQAADGGHAVCDQRDHHQRTDQVAPTGRDVQRELQRIGHDGGFKRKKDEGEGGVDQRGQRGAYVAKTRAARQQIHVHAVTRGVNADGQAGQENDQPGRYNRPESIGKTVLHQQGGAHGFQDQEGSRAKGRVGDTPLGPFAKTLRRKTQRIVLHGLAGYPAVVVAPDLDDALHRYIGTVRAGALPACRGRTGGQVAGWRCCVGQGVQ